MYQLAEGWLKLILGFLVDLKLVAKKRHEAVKCLLNSLVWRLQNQSLLGIVYHCHQVTLWLSEKVE